MKIEKSKNRIFIEFKNGFIIDIWENLSEIIFFRRFNWNVWQFINLEFENDRAMHGQEITFVFLCCGIRIRWDTKPEKEHDVHKRVMNSMDILKNSCHGWTNTKEYNYFKNKKTQSIFIFKTRRKGYNKRIFIQ